MTEPIAASDDGAARPQPAQEPTVGSRWKDKAMERFVVIVGLTDAKVSYRNEATGRLTVTRTTTFTRGFRRWDIRIFVTDKS